LVTEPVRVTVEPLVTSELGMLEGLIWKYSSAVGRAVMVPDPWLTLVPLDPGVEDRTWADRTNDPLQITVSVYVLLALAPGAKVPIGGGGLRGGVTVAGTWRVASARLANDRAGVPLTDTLSWRVVDVFLMVT
jgi:hypothetical protein